MQDKIHAIATRVMGGIPSNAGWASVVWQTIGGTWMVTIGETSHAFNPYESGADCFMVLDRMAELGYMFTKEGYSEHKVWFTATGELNRYGYAFNGDLKTAICDAALKAVEG